MIRKVIFIVIVIFALIAWQKGYFDNVKNIDFKNFSKTWSFVQKTQNTSTQTSISDFDSCVAAGNPVMESYPRQCSANGKTFNEVILDKDAVSQIQILFQEKYPKYKETLTIKINQAVDNFARGSVSFEKGKEGGIFLAAKVNNAWKIVHDGNGQIPCSLVKQGFPSSMLSDCAE